MSELLKPVLSIEDTPGMPEAIAHVVRSARGQVCGVCGLERMGHAPESRWLGHPAHDWTPVPATSAMIGRARELTVLAYASR